MLLSKIIGGALLCLKTLEFLSFHIVQETSMVIEAMDFRCGVVAPVLLAHHSMTEPSVSQVEVSMWASPSLMMIKFHSLTVKRHLKKRCGPDSGSLLQRGQSPQFGHPRLANLSA